MTINRRSFIGALIGTPALAVLASACGDDQNLESSGDTGPGDDTGGGADGGIQYPTDAVVLRLGSEGGFVPVGFSFTNIPTLLINGDGQTFRPGMQTLIFPGPLLPPIGTRTITPEGIQKLLELADEAGLLASPPDYSAEIMVADVPDTVLTITTAAGTFEHRAMALGFNIDDEGNPAPEVTPARERLALFVQLLGDIDNVVGSENLGPESVFDATEYRFQAIVTDQANLDGFDPPATVVEWPASVGLPLAEASVCSKGDSNELINVLAAADQNTFFTEGDVLYQVSAVAVLPGDVC